MGWHGVLAWPHYTVPALVTSAGHSVCSGKMTTFAQSAAFQLMPLFRLAISAYLASLERLPNTVTCRAGRAAHKDGIGGGARVQASRRRHTTIRRQTARIRPPRCVA